MKVLWLCNMMLPVVGVHLGLATSPKEGWLSGLLGQVLADDQNRIESFALAFPVGRELLSREEDPSSEEAGILQGTLECQGRTVEYYGFYEDTTRPECYDAGLEDTLREVIRCCQPDMVHIFGTEYPHTLAMTRAYGRPERTLIGIQGLCEVYARAYFADLPERVIRSVTLRDFLKKDSLVQQQQKFAKRGQYEVEAVKNVGHITGRTHWDKYYTGLWNPGARYHMMNETLRKEFYQGAWDPAGTGDRAIFLSQGDYPIKGLHYMLLALPAIRKQYPETRVYVAGNSIIKDKSLKDRLKISAYGKYLKKLLKQLKLQDAVVFLGRLDAEQMKEQYLRSSLFVCCSSIENSPNSLGEAMILGVPCVSADVGGVATMLVDGQEGILYRGFSEETSGQLTENAANLANAVLKLWGNEQALVEYCENARNHARITHDGNTNYERLMEIYTEILTTPEV